MPKTTARIKQTKAMTAKIITCWKQVQVSGMFFLIISRKPISANAPTTKNSVINTEEKNV